MPEIKKQVSQAVETAQKSFEQIDMKQVSNKAQKAVQDVKNKINNLKKSSQNNDIAIKINNKEAKKQISQIEKQIDSLQKKVGESKRNLKIVNSKTNAIIDNTSLDERLKMATTVGLSTKHNLNNDTLLDYNISKNLNNNSEYTNFLKQQEILTSNIEKYKSQIDEAKNKLVQLSQVISETATSQNKLTSFSDTFKSKLQQAKTSTNTLKNSFKQINPITQNITNNIKKMSLNVKQGIGNVLKYAGALFGLSTIYNTLKSSASAWLSSQNEGAQQLSANIEYMKYAMRKCICTCYRVCY